MNVVIKRLIAIGLSFCFGLIVFYMPGRQYSSLAQVWLPQGLSSERQDVLMQPVASWPNSAGGVRFTPLDPGAPEIIEINSAPHMQAAHCPDIFGVEEQSPTKCHSVYTIGETQVYGYVPRKSSPNMYVYMQMDKMLVALTGFDSAKDAATYLKAFGMVARRDVNTQLGKHKSEANRVVSAIRQEKQRASEQKASAYKYLPFSPVLPSILPAGWMQKLVRIDGTDPKHPTAADIFYRKGLERNITLSMVSAASFVIGNTCGPVPGAAEATIQCAKVANQEYYAGGNNDGTTANWYLFRQVGDTVAIVQVSAFAENNHPPLLLNKDLETQAAIAGSLHATTPDALKGATFRGASSDPYPWIKP